MFDKLGTIKDIFTKPKPANCFTSGYKQPGKLFGEEDIKVKICRRNLRVFLNGFLLSLQDKFLCNCGFLRHGRETCHKLSMAPTPFLLQKNVGSTSNRGEGSSQLMLGSIGTISHKKQDTLHSKEHFSLQNLTPLYMFIVTLSLLSCAVSGNPMQESPSEITNFSNHSGSSGLPSPPFATDSEIISIKTNLNIQNFPPHLKTGTPRDKSDHGRSPKHSKPVKESKNRRTKIKGGKHHRRNSTDHFPHHNINSDDDDDDGIWEDHWGSIEDLKRWEESFRGHKLKGHEKKKKRYVDPKDFKFVNPKPADLQIECMPLRSKRYFSDGFCTSVRPVDDHVCTGSCLPIGDLPWYAEYIKVWSKAKTHEYRCVDDVVVHKKISFACHNGQTRTYTIPVVQNCKCKRYDRNQNRPPGVWPSKRRKVPKPINGTGRGGKRDNSRGRRRQLKPSNGTVDDQKQTIRHTHLPIISTTRPSELQQEEHLNQTQNDMNYQHDSYESYDTSQEEEVDLLDQIDPTEEASSHQNHRETQENLETKAPLYSDYENSI